MLFLVFVSIFCYLATSDLNFLVGGDWGGQSGDPYVTDDQLSSANIMNEIASTYDATMVWMMGDNFYDFGVTSVSDIRFEKTFENVYNTSSLGNIPFWMVAGNHDWRGNNSAQVEYSNYNDRWIYPSYYYTQSWDVPGTDYILQLVMIDTMLLCGCNSNNVSNYHYCNFIPSDDNGTVAKTEWDWINATLNASTADFLIVAGHFPVWSAGIDGTCDCLNSGLRGALIDYDVSFFVNGHDHNLQLIIEDEYPDLLYITTGAIHLCEDTTENIDEIPVDSLKYHGCQDGGFIRINIGTEGMVAEFYLGNSTDVVYTTDTIAARTSTDEADSAYVKTMFLYLSIVVSVFMLNKQ